MLVVRSVALLNILVCLPYKGWRVRALEHGVRRLLITLAAFVVVGTDGMWGVNRAGEGVAKDVA